MGKKLQLKEKEKEEIQFFLIKRFKQLDGMRQNLDTDILEEIELYNNIDKYVDNYEEWQSKNKVPYTYTIVQTIIARLIETLFSEDNYIRIFVEDGKESDIERSLQNWVQEILDIMKFKYQARDFLEEALIQRTVWLHPIPNIINGKFKGIKLNILKWFDVWFDMSAKNVDETDFFIKKIVKLYTLFQRKDIYFNLEDVKNSIPPDDIKKQQEYKAKNGDYVYYSDTGNVNGKVELLEYYGEWNFGTIDDPNIKDVIFVLANRQVLIRAEINDLETKRKKLFFPIRPLRQANSLVGKSIPQIMKDQQYELNETRSLRMQNAKTLVKLLWKYRRDAGIDFDELFVEGGNAIGYDDNPDDIQPIIQNNLVQILIYIENNIMNSIQQVTGATDFIMGTAGGGATTTASGIRQITQQGLQKFSMMAMNTYQDIIDFINFVIILYKKYDKSEILLKRPELEDFIGQEDEKIEDSIMVDITMKDLSMRRDIEQSQFINAFNIIGTLLPQVGGNMKELLRQVMKTLKMQNIDKILTPDEQQQQQQMLSMLQQASSQGGGTPNQVSKLNNAKPEEIANEINYTKTMGK